MPASSSATAPAASHLWITGPSRAARAAHLATLAAPPAWMAPVSAHRNLRGPYTATGTVLRHVIPGALDRCPDLVARHEIELLSVAPELHSVVPTTLHTLTSLAVPEERTRYYSTLRTLRLAHGLVELIRDYLTAAQLGPVSLVVDDLDQADYTDQEFFAVLLRRIDPALLTVVIGSAADPAALASSALPPGVRPVAGSLPVMAEAFCQRSSAADGQDESEVADQEAAARSFVQTDCTDDRAGHQAAYQALPLDRRQQLHDARAAELAAAGEKSLELGALRLHLTLGSDPLGAGVKQAHEVLNYCMGMGFYDTALEAAEQGRALCGSADQLQDWLLLSVKLPTILSTLGRVDEAEAMCEHIRARTDDPTVQLQMSYATAMLYTRHLEPSRRDHDRALGWINNAIALSSQLADPSMRTIDRVFNENGRALIEAHRGRADLALELVSNGIATLDAQLRPDEHRLHRSVLRYNRAQVLASLGRLEEALADYRAVLEVDPNYPEYHFDVANLLHRLGEDEQALRYYEQAIRLSPPFPEVHYNRADVLVDLGRVEEALAGFSYVLELDPEHVDALLNRASLLADLDEPDAADADVSRALALDPRHPHLLSLRGRLELEAGRLDTARAALDAALEIDAGMAEAWALRGAVNYEDADLPGALADLSRSIELHPDAAVLFNRGAVHQALRDWAAACRDFDQVLDSDPEEADAWLRRAQCRAELGDLAGAGADARQFLRLDPDRAEEAAGLLDADRRSTAGALG